jgi:4-amino-4-deoxy-L-arabinose transferase-like glycosyltransferase
MLSFHFFNKPPFVSWLIAFFVFLGFVLHLVLDELYSVDFMGYRLKRSFGTALKLFDFKERLSSAVIIVGIVVTWFFTPDAKQFIDTLLSSETYQVILKRMF